MPNVEIYSTNVCPYCVRAKALLSSKGVEFTEYNISNDDDARATMMERTGGARSVPQIFINDVHYGGSDELYTLDAEGKLDAILAG
tara:strand:- start:11052 stop:11309 length:258 start_codon:yes stop_codon:yes gene_type:complete